MLSKHAYFLYRSEKCELYSMYLERFLYISSTAEIPTKMADKIWIFFAENWLGKRLLETAPKLLLQVFFPYEA